MLLVHLLSVSLSDDTQDEATLEAVIREQQKLAILELTALVPRDEATSGRDSNFELKSQAKETIGSKQALYAHLIVKRYEQPKMSAGLVILEHLDSFSQVSHEVLFQKPEVRVQITFG